MRKTHFDCSLFIVLFFFSLRWIPVAAGLTITTDSLPSGMEMVPYSTSLEATNGTLPFTWSAIPSIIGWGDNAYGQTVMPTGLANVVAIEAGAGYNLALKSDGKVAAWGRNAFGDTTVPSLLSNVIAIAAGYYHSLALKSDGTVVAWGGASSQIHDVPPGLSNVVAIEAGQYHSVALKSDGTAVSWGFSTAGQTNIPPGLSDVVAIDAGGQHSMALKSDGVVIAWGENLVGQTNVPPALSNVVAIAAGGSHSLALKSDGTVVAWGSNQYGQTNVPPGLSNVVAISCGAYHNLALTSEGTVVSWGYNGYSQTNVPPGLHDVVELAGGVSHSLILRSKGMELPIGLSCSTNGVVAGTPYQAGTNVVTVVVRDAVGETTNKPMEIVIAPYLGEIEPESEFIFVPEGGATNFQVKLKSQPPRATVVEVCKTDGDTDIGVEGVNRLTFTPENWADDQAIILSAAEDNGDNQNGSATISFTGLGISNITVEAFEIDDDFTLSVSATHGTINQEPNLSLYDKGTTVNLTAVPDAGYHLTDWSGGVSGSTNPTSVSITSNTSVTAHFALNVITVLTDRVSVSVPEGGSTNFQVKLSAQPTGDTVVAVGDTVGDRDIGVSGGSALTFTIGNWDTYQNVTLMAAEDNSDNVNGSATITCSGLGLSNCAVVATEVDDDYTLTVTSPYGTVARTPDTPYYDKGILVTLSATPYPAFYWKGYTGDLTDTNNPAFLVMDADKSVTAEYAPAAPVVLPPKSIGKKNFTARWKWLEGGAPEGQIGVSVDSAFTIYVPGYRERYVVNSTECMVTNLAANHDFLYRIRRVMPDGSFSPWSSAMKVRTGTGLPVFKNLLSDVPVSKGITQEFPISKLLAGTGTLQVKSSNINAVKASISGGVLKLQYLWNPPSTTARMTMTLTHPTNHYSVSYSATLRSATGKVGIVWKSALTNAGTRVAQEMTLKNKTGGMIYGLRVRVKGLDNPAWLINRTGFDPVSKAPILEIPCVLPAGSQTVVRLIYNKAYKAQAATRPVKYAAWAVMTPVNAVKPMSGEMVIAKRELYDGLWLLGLPVDCNRLYTIYHSDDDGVTWTLDLPAIRATANYLMWMDLNDAAPGNRIYRVVDAGM